MVRVPDVLDARAQEGASQLKSQPGPDERVMKDRAQPGGAKVVYDRGVHGGLDVARLVRDRIRGFGLIERAQPLFGLRRVRVEEGRRQQRFAGGAREPDEVMQKV